MNDQKKTVEAMKQPDREIQKFTGDTLWMALALGVQTLLTLVTIPVLTKMLHTELYGVWTQISATMGIVSPLLILGLDTTYIRFMGGERDKDKIRQALGLVLWPGTAVGVILLLISFFVQDGLSRVIFADARYNYFVPLIFVWAMAQALFALSYSYYKASRTIRRVALTQMTCSIVQAAAVSVLALQRADLLWITVASILVQAVFAAVNFSGIIAGVGWPLPRLAGLKKYLLFSIPLVPSSLLLWVMNSNDRYFITHYLSISDTGTYSVSASLAGICAFFLTPIAYNVFYTIAGFWERGDRDKVRFYLEYAARLFLTLVIPAATGLTLLSQDLLKVFTTSEFMAGESLVLLISLGSIFLGIYQINVYVVLLVEKTRWIPLMIVISAVISAGLNAILIPRIGVIGAAISNLVSYLALASIVTAWAQKAISYSMDLVYLAKVMAASLVMAFCLYFLRDDNLPRLILSVCGGIVVFALMMLLLKAFSKQDVDLMKQTLGGFMPRKN